MLFYDEFCGIHDEISDSLQMMEQYKMKFQAS